MRAVEGWVIRRRMANFAAEILQLMKRFIQIFVTAAALGGAATAAQAAPTDNQATTMEPAAQGAAKSVPADTSRREAILMVHFGTTHDDTRAMTIDAITADVAREFAPVEVREAYSSRIVRKRLADKGITKLTPTRALLGLAAEGYTDVTVQASHLLDAIEAQALRDEVAAAAPFFNSLRVGLPVLHNSADTRRLADILAEVYSPLEAYGGHVVFVGHGTEHPSGAVYSELDYMLTDAGHPRMHVATVEGFPELANVMPRLKGARRVTLVPLLMVAGDHAKNDIATSMRSALEQAGYKVDVKATGLGELPQVRRIIVDRIGQAREQAPLTPSEIKAAFIKDNL